MEEQYMEEQYMDEQAAAERKDADCRFLFSVVMAVYNTQDYLGEAIDSVIDQTIGFREHIQIILVDDGSTDESGSICERYVSEWPDNIICIHQKNAGVSAARNAGLKAAEGRYVNFMDSDDKWSRAAFGTAARFFSKHPDVCIVSAKYRFFGNKDGTHPLNYKHKEERVIDLLRTPDFPQCSVNSAFIEQIQFKQNPFDTHMAFAEDIAVVNTLLLENPKYGVLKKPVYWYRKSGGSAIDSSVKRKTYYLDTPVLCHRMLFERSEKKYGYVLPFIQYTVMYDLQWRLKTAKRHPLSADELERYREICRFLLSKIDDRIILMQRNISRSAKLSVLALKRGCSTDFLREHLCVVNRWLYLSEPDGHMVHLWDVKQDASVQLLFLERRNDRLYLEGRLFVQNPPEQILVAAETKKKTYQADLFIRNDMTSDAFFERGANRVLGFSLLLPLRSFELKLMICGKSVKPSAFYGKYMPLRNREYSYAAFGDISVTREGTNKFIVKRRKSEWFLKREILLEREIKADEKTSDVFDACLRRLAFRNHTAIASGTKKERIWLISDREDLAGDNGEALFTYLVQNPVPGIKPYFVILKDSRDFARMEQIGPVVPYFSEQHKQLFVQADAVLSAGGEETIIRLSEDTELAMEGFPYPKFVFLQHGVIHNDLSAWLRKWNKNIDLFCTSAFREYRSIALNDRYGYGPQKVKLTGLARHDKLLAAAAGKAPEKKILICPTWRKWAASITHNGVRAYNPKLKETDYFSFYDRLLNDEQIAQAAAENGFTADYIVHPSLMHNLSDFSSTWCTIRDDYDYTQEFVSSAILLTDYSSVVFDFAILEKPLIYVQFDAERFRTEHSSQPGYFSYEADGFGPVCSTYEEMRDELIRLMHDPVMPQKYRERVNGFFGPLDGHACERIIEATLSIER